jgi:CheY-like chemotaxis protein
LLAFSRTQKLATAPVDVNALVNGMHELLSQTLGPNITVSAELAPRLPAATADANQLELAILNLAINARDAMPDGGTLTITTALAPDDAVMIEVADTGTGVPPDVAARAFDPFFTTKEAGKGTGLGLSQVYGIVRQSGGEVALRSEVGKGTRITMRLRRATDNAVAQSQSDPDLLRARRAEKLLIVDDDPDVREIVGGVLQELGYVVRSAPLPDEGLAIMREFNPDLLILDFAMPGTNGAETAMLARKQRPDLRILFLSGFADTGALEAAVGDAPLLRKPFPAH